MSWFFKDEPSAPVDARTARRRATWMSLPFAAMGLLALVLLLHDGLLGGLDKRKLFQLLGVIAASIGFVALIFGVTAKKSSLAGQLQSALSEDSEKPWLKRADWAAGRIKSVGIPHAKSYLFMGIALCVLGGLIAVLVVPKALQGGNYSALVALLFPAVGIAFLTTVVRRFLAHRRFGDCHFEMTEVPAPVGGALDGAIQTGLPLTFEKELRLELCCVRKITSGTGQNRRTDEKILWRDEIIFKSRVEVPESPSRPGGVPGHFALPPGQPECFERGNEAVCWRLEMKIPAANFHSTFDVPVFKTADSGAVPKDG